MFNAFERMLAFRYLRARREEGFLSMFTVIALVGIILGVGTLVVVTAVMDGYKRELVARIVDINGQISVRAQQGPIVGYTDLSRKLRFVDGVESATPFYVDKALLSKGLASSVANVNGIRKEDILAKPAIAQNIVEGELDAFGPKKLLLGSRLAEKLGVKIGDEVTFLSASLEEGAGTGETRLATFQLVATFDVGLFEYDTTTAFLEFEDAKDYFDAIGATHIEINGKDNANQSRLYESIFSALPGGLLVTDWRKANTGFLNMVNTQRNVLFIILSLIVLVAAINIISGQIMLVNSKTRDIAILRTMGATRKNILRSFFMVGAIIGVIGTFLGVTLGWLFAVNIDSIRLGLESLLGFSLFDAEQFKLAKMPAIVTRQTLIWVICMSLLLTLMASLYPAWKAARQSPIEGIRNA